MSHANAASTPRARLRLARLIVDAGWPVARAAERYDVSWPTAKRWADRYAESGPAAMADRSSRPHRSPARTTQPQVRKIVHLRWKQRLGPVQIAGRLGMPASTVHAVLTRCRINRLSHIDRATGEPVRRYEHDHPGAMLHIDVKKLGNVPDGGGWRYVGRVQGRRNRAATPVRWAVRETPFTLAEVWAMASANPARALGLTGRGVIEAGARADLCVAEWEDGSEGRLGLVTALVGGAEV